MQHYMATHRWAFRRLQSFINDLVEIGRRKLGLGSPDPQVRRLLGVEGGLGRGLGIADDFAVTMISAVGNYGEMFDRNLGSGSQLGIDRGLSKLYTQGGILYAPPNR